MGNRRDKKSKNSKKNNNEKYRKHRKHRNHERKYKTPKKNIRKHNKVRLEHPESINVSRFSTEFKVTRLYKNPYIASVRKLLSNFEIRAIKELASQHEYERSVVVTDSGSSVISSYRTSKTKYISDDGHKYDYSDGIESLLKKIQYLTGCKRNQIESLMVVRYDEGEEYYNHHDYFLPEHDEYIEGPGNRLFTFFCYLNTLDIEDGGETEFPQIGVKSRPVKGTAAFWRNIKHGELLDDTLHRGNPVNIGSKVRKLGLNVWVREYGW